MMNGCGGGMLLWTLLLAGLIGVGIWLLVRAVQGGQGGQSDGSSAVRILEERFARGEIDRDEYEERRRTLGD